MDAHFRTCLLIDDSPLDNLINSTIIKRDNFASEVIIVEAPEKALSLLSSGKVKPDIIFLDIRMPEMSGFDFLVEYGNLDIEKNHTKILILSSSIDPRDIRKAEDNRYVSGYLAKSLTPDALRKIEC
ncbi:response regulator [Mucilaginibacter sp. UYCu711]|uniref:response regulator n=1 Tax=Mucilaginibacter sp. UYCu711 TaxID=3156339 RepID=UPI003D1CA134